MSEEYIIINKTAIQKRIEELKYQRELAGNLFEDREYNLNHISMELRMLEQFLSQSSPLTPELEKVWNAARETVMVGTPPFEGVTVKYKTLEEYLKTNI